MAFFDRLKEKTGDMIEITKINNKINEEKRKIASRKAELAEYYWTKFESGELLDDGATAICNDITACNNAILEYNQEIVKIKEESAQPAPAAQQAQSLSAASTLPVAPPAEWTQSVAPPAAAPADPPAEPIRPAAPQSQVMQTSAEPAAEESRLCQSCGISLPVSKKFCPECGTPNVPPAPVVEESTSCRNCGASLTKGKKFCSECGTPVTAG